jgi:hypothetical protein
MLGAADDDEGPAMTGCSSSESDDGKNKSGSDFGAIEGDECALISTNARRYVPGQLWAMSRCEMWEQAGYERR